MIGCNSGDEPKSVLSDFIEAVSRKDFTTAKRYTTPESSSMLGLLEMATKMAPDTSAEKNYKMSSLDFGETKLQGDKAMIAVKSKLTGETTNYTLKKIGNEWKVAFDKASMKPKGNKMHESIGTDSLNKLIEIHHMNSDSSIISKDTLH